MEAFSKLIPLQLQARVIGQLFHPSAMCQVCLSQKNQPSDFIITCQICRDSVHQTHYASQLLYGVGQKWICQRCQFFIDKKPTQPIKCKYCPFTKGIMKQMTFQIKDAKQRQKVWMHPVCGSWQFPRNYFKCKKRQNLIRELPLTQTAKFWVNEQGPIICDVCKSDYGYPYKCKYRTCTKFYHIQCGKKQGVIRQMQKMKIQNTMNYIPIYCKDHIQKRITDFKMKTQIANQRGDYQRGQHYCKWAKICQKQLKELQRFASKYQKDEKLRQQFINHYNNSMQQQQQPLINSVSGSNKTEHSQSFYDFLQQLRPHEDDEQSKEIMGKGSLLKSKNYVISGKSSQHLSQNNQILQEMDIQQCQRSEILNDQRSFMKQNTNTQSQQKSNQRSGQSSILKNDSSLQKSLQKVQKINNDNNDNILKEVKQKDQAEQQVQQGIPINKQQKQKQEQRQKVQQNYRNYGYMEEESPGSNQQQQQQLYDPRQDR